MATETSSTLEDHLAVFGLSEFRPGQRDVISALIDGKNCLCIMPTGGGKSLCYQLPAVAREGVTLVVSPLIALMKDQVDGLQSQGLRATCINSAITVGEQHQRLEAMSKGAFDLVYIAPERLRNARFLEAVRSVKVQLLAVDEAHCISEWGHDFRPDYARLGRFRERLGNPQTIALTATATPDVRDDIVKQLQLDSPEVFIKGFARPNLRFEVLTPSGSGAKDDALLDLLEEMPGAGIIYASTRKACEELAELLNSEQERRVGLYHAGLMPDQRRLVQERFMAGDVPIIVATNAFGMGIDKADLRFVIHYNMPGTLEAYYQEAGRAGRDGDDSRCTLLFSYSDRFVQEFFIENRYPSPETVRRVYDYLRSIKTDPIEITLQDLKERLDLDVGSEGVGACEQILEKAGVLERMSARENVASIKIDSELPTLVDLLPKEAKVQRKVLRAIEREVDDRRYEWVYFQPQRLADRAEIDRDALTRALRELLRLDAFDYVPPFRGRAIHMVKRDVPFEQLGVDFDELQRRKAAELEKLDRVIRYAQTRQCRQVEILDYFGDPQRTRCGNCDRCRPDEAVARVERDTDQDAFAPGVIQAVRIALAGAARTHGRFGKTSLAQMLCGSTSAKVTRLNLHKLSTYGLLDDLRQTEVVELLDALVGLGLLEQVETTRHRPTVQLTELGGQVMREKAEMPAALPVSPELLRRLRAKLRAPQTTPPPAAEPATQAAEIQQPASEPEASSVAPSGPQPSYYWTWQLLADGYTLQQCAEIRQTDVETLLDHLARACDEGLEVSLDWFCDDDQQQHLEQVANTFPGHQLASIDRIPDGISPQRWQLYVKCATS